MSLPPPLSVSRLEARAFMRRALNLDSPVRSVEEALAHHGYIQIDPINVCGRMHDHILRVRVAHYREGDLVRHLHGEETAPLRAEERIAFEHHLPSTRILVAFALDAWPHLLAAQRERSRSAGSWSGRLTPRERELATRILDEIRARGALSSDMIEDGRRRGRAVWGSATLVKATMQKLFFHGRLLIAGRAAGRRKYDLPERVLPARILAMPEPAQGDTTRWLAEIALRQRRLVAFRKVDIAAVEDLIQPVKIEGQGKQPGPLLYCLRSDVPLFSPPPNQAHRATLLAPLEPLIYDRKVTRHVWDFDYAWEAYTPAHKRKRGHYAMPILAGLELVGHVDPKADREAGRLRAVSRRVRRGHGSSAPFKELASFLGLRT